MLYTRAHLQLTSGPIAVPGKIGKPVDEASVTRHVANRVRELRTRRRWSARRLAAECIQAGGKSLTRGTIAKIESGGRRHVTAGELAVLAEVLQVSPADLLGSSSPPWDPAVPPSHNAEHLMDDIGLRTRTFPTFLPEEASSFIGRERELSELRRMLGHTRTLTLTGPGGIGKTRLALRVLASVSDEFPDGSLFVELADLQHPGQVVPRVAAVTGVADEPERPLAETLADALRSRRLVLALDNCEHLIEACAELGRQLLASSPGLKLLTTSREPLRIAGETIWRVPPLSTPPSGTDLTAGQADQYEAIRLFADRAAASHTGFTVGQDNAATVASICRALDGIPLAIELAAARVRTLSVEQISARLNDRFALLTGGDRSAAPRQHTLGAAIEWSYELLTRPEEALFRRLSVFDGWPLDMAEQICSDEVIPEGAVLGLLVSLIDKSLVAVDGEVAGGARYRLLDTIKEYAAERLAAAGEKDALSLRHRDYILGLVEQTASRMFNRGEPPWPVRREVFRRGIAEFGNFRIALATSLSHEQPAEGLRLCIALLNMWVPHGDQREAATWFDRFLVQEGREVSLEVRGRALAGRADIAFDLADYDTLLRSAQQSLELSRACGDDVTVPTALRTLGQAALQAGRFAEAGALIEEAIEAADTAGNDWEAGLTRAAQAAIEVRQNKLKSAQRWYEAALELLSDNNRWGAAQVQYGMGTLAQARGDADMALRRFEEAAQIFREMGAGLEIARCLVGTGSVALLGGDLDLAWTRLAESLRISRACGQRSGIASGLEAFAALAAARQQPEQATRLAGAATQLRESLGQPISLGSGVDRMLELARDRLGWAAAAAIFAEGREMTVDDAVGYALGSSIVGASDIHGAREPAWADPARRSPSPLTPREYEIVVLITRGLSNRGIADELIISPATAARHVANIMSKLGFSSRAQIASWAARLESPA
jgi:predicted ATPase/DNA-binding CsgD family transcriptional regulator/DNA-binding Xre family transcriptional regulator